MLYGGAATMALMASVYLLFRRGNAFAPDITTPVRLRLWTAAFFASLALGHVWYLPVVFFTTDDGAVLSDLIGGLLDSLVVFPLAIVILFEMLQDRRRPLWPVGVMVAPMVVGIVMCLGKRSTVYLPLLRGYFVLLDIGLVVYMSHEVWRYGHWLRDNYADLEHKEVWHSLVVLASVLLVLGFYTLGVGGVYYDYIVQVACILLVGYLLWRVETLSDLSTHWSQSLSTDEAAVIATLEGNVLSANIRENIGSLLQQYCVDTQLYLQHDLTLAQLAKAVGTNRYYLSQYFSSQGLTYNLYINNLRINHFVSLYREAVAAQRPFTVVQLASNSGYRSYSTFSLAFKQRMGQNVSAWMRGVKDEMRSPFL